MLFLDYYGVSCLCFLSHLPIISPEYFSEGSLRDIRFNASPLLATLN